MRTFKKYPKSIQASKAAFPNDKMGMITIEISPWGGASIKYGAETLESFEYKTNADIAKHLKRCLDKIFPEVH